MKLLVIGAHADDPEVSMGGSISKFTNSGNDVKLSVLMYEQLTLGGISPDSFKSHVYVDITETIEDKIKSIKSYKFLSESDIEAVYSLSRFRGNQIGVKYAECFEVCKVIANIDNGYFSIGKIPNL